MNSKHGRSSLAGERQPAPGARQQPLKPNLFLMLVVLLDGPTHGYSLLKEVETRSSGRLGLQAGTLYRLLAGLLDKGWVEESGERPDPELDDQRRRYYQLTAAGRSATLAEGRRLAELVDSLRDRRLLDRPETV